MSGGAGQLAQRQDYQKAHGGGEECVQGHAIVEERGWQGEGLEYVDESKQTSLPVAAK
jgi:hypothetical protein